MSSAIKRPLIAEGSTFVHRRAKTLINAVSEQGYFTRYRAGKSKPEVL